MTAVSTSQVSKGDFALAGWRSLSEQVKARRPGALVLFKCGDFYELFGEDAATAGAAAGLSVSKQREASTGALVERAGVPYHAIDRYTRHLAELGYTVAILEEA